VNKLQFICIKTERVYIGRRRTTSFRPNGNDASNKRENLDTKRVSLFWPTLDFVSGQVNGEVVCGQLTDSR